MNPSLAPSHDSFLRQAFVLAGQAKHKGNHPFAALLVLDHAVVLTAENSVTTDRDATRHAEMNLAGLACRELTPVDRTRAILYTSTEPCAMCSGAIYWAGIRTIVFGCSSKTLAAFAGQTQDVGCRDIFGKGTEVTRVIGPHLEAEASTLHRGFWS